MAAGVFVGDADNPEDLGGGWLRFYGLATSSSSYGGYGGNENTSREDKYKVRDFVVDGSRTAIEVAGCLNT
eukprot:14346807-Ditylum_brightwellii.AAC.1